MRRYNNNKIISHEVIKPDPYVLYGLAEGSITITTYDMFTSTFVS